MPAKPSPILGGFSTARSPNASDNEAVNLFVEIVETKDGKVPGWMSLMSGTDLLYDVGTGPIRPGGMLELKDTLYVCSGSEVWSISANGTKTMLGTINGTSEPVSMFQNTLQLLILDGSGAWLVPGGLPLTGGTISGGSLYAIGDTIILQAKDGGTENAFPQIKITGISNNPATSAQISFGGTTYNSATNVATTPIQPQSGIGTGLTLDVTASGTGGVAAIAVNSGGNNYANGDTGSINGAGSGASYIVTNNAAGVVTTVELTTTGAGYVTGAAQATTRGVAFPVNVGVGLTVNTNATAGPISQIATNQGGQNYAVGNVFGITGGTSNAIGEVVQVGGQGNVTSFIVVSGGAITAATTEYTQQSTDGSGQNLTLLAPQYGTFIGLVPIALPFDNPTVGCVVDGFGLAVFASQQVIAQSNQQDLSTWPALAFGVANQSPDNIVSIASLHDEAYVFKDRNSEVWANQGTSPFAFGPLTGVHIEAGCCAPFSVIKTGNDLIWLSATTQGQGIFMKASAYSPERISTQALVFELQKYTTLADCIAYARQEGQHSFYVATFPTRSVTWCYDMTSSELAGFPVWTKMATLDNGELIRHLGNAFTTWQGSLPPTSVTTDYQAQSVTMLQTNELDTTAALNGLITSFSTAVFSVWVALPDGATNSGIVFGNQQGGTKPGIQFTVQDDGFSGPQIEVQAWDAAGNPIVVAQYSFTAWANWVNVLISIDTVNQKLQVWANTITANVLIEDELTADSIVWSSSNPIGVLPATPWSLRVAQ